MAKKKAEDPVAKVLAEARKALLLSLLTPTPRPLLGTAASPGFFSGSTQAVKDAAKLCEERGWLVKTGEAAGTGAKAKPMYRLTEQGARAAVAGLAEPAVGALRAQVDQLDRTARALEAALAPLRAALASPVTAPVAQAPEAPRAAAPAEGPLTRERLREVLKQKYDYLRQMVEFEDGIVALPPLYDKAREALPGLNIERFHEELLALWREQQIELHILNEVHRAERPEVGIYQKNTLYYYLYWKRRP